MSDETFMYLTTTGHKSGQPHEIEIWYVVHEDAYYMISEHEMRSHWVQNIQHNPAVRYKVVTRAVREHFPSLSGIGRIVNPNVEPDLAAAVRGLMNAKYEWSTGVIVEVKKA